VASELSIPFLAIGAGHAVTITSKKLNGLQIDLSNFNTVEYNAASSTIVVGGGARFGDIYSVLFVAGKEVRKFLWLRKSRHNAE
jgi:FAD/FMN-containing dehydrogenase